MSSVERPERDEPNDDSAQPHSQRDRGVTAPPSVVVVRLFEGFTRLEPWTYFPLMQTARLMGLEPTTFCMAADLNWST